MRSFLPPFSTFPNTRMNSASHLLPSPGVGKYLPIPTAPEWDTAALNRSGRSRASRSAPYPPMESPAVANCPSI